MKTGKEAAPGGRNGARDKTDDRTIIQVVEFALGREMYAIDLSDVREVVEYSSITKIPNAPPSVRGIIDLRGEITTIMDLGGRLGIQGERMEGGSSRIIVLDEKVAGFRCGILVDDVSSVTTFERKDIEYVKDSFAGSDSPVNGIIRKKVGTKETGSHELVIWLDIRGLISGFKSR